MAEGKQGAGRAAYYLESALHFQQRYPAFHRPSMELFLSLADTYAVLMAALARRTGNHGLSPSGLNALVLLARAGAKGHPLCELSRMLLVSAANITGVVDNLSRKGFVRRAMDHRDRRVRIAKITPAGEALLDSVLPGHYAEVRQLLGGLGDREKAAACRLLAKLRRGIEHSEPDAGKSKGRR